MKKIILGILPIVDVFLVGFVYMAAFLLKNIRALGIKQLPFCRNALFQIGVFPIRDHYYEPLFHPRHIKYPLSKNRSLPGVNWESKKQLELLTCFKSEGELNNIPMTKKDEKSFYMGNPSFGPGDAEFWYHLIRLKKPKRIYEIGCGNSTLMAIEAISKNKQEIDDYKCKHVCIEPYEKPWLENTGVSVIRKKVEDVGKELFSELEENDILFIDSSHIIRPQGDVLFEYLELLPSLNKGVIVHVHDIFSPKDYPDNVILNNILFWNEQYLLEAFLTSNHVSPLSIDRYTPSIAPT